MPLTSRWNADALAAIDLGSNSCRLEIARLRGSQYRNLHYRKEPVRLGAGLDAEGLLTEAAMQRGLDCLARFAQELEGFPRERIRAVATQTLREARNRDDFLRRGQALLGLPIEVIPGREEARLIYTGVQHLQPSDDVRLVIDIGGRSTELILGHGARPLRADSFQVGSVGLSVRFFPDGVLSAERFRAAQVAVAAELEEAVALFGRGHAEPAWDEALGSSGTVGAVAQIVSAAGFAQLDLPALQWCIEACLRAGHVDALQLPGLKADRRGVVAGGLCILYTLLTQFGIGRLKPAKGALRQGLIVELAERLKPTQRGDDPRPRAVAEVQQRLGVDIAQAERVRTLAVRLFHQLCPQSAPEAARELGWTADWHELGHAVSHHDYHRHSHYLIGHLDAAGFSQTQLRRMALIALGQRGGLRKLDLGAQDLLLRWQVLALRLAVIKAHGRTPLDVDAWDLQQDGSTVRLLASRGWVQRRPQTLFLLQEEAAAWARSGLLSLRLPG